MTIKWINEPPASDPDVSHHLQQEVINILQQPAAAFKSQQQASFASDLRGETQLAGRKRHRVQLLFGLCFIVIAACLSMSANADIFSDNDRSEDGFFFYKGEDVYNVCKSTDASSKRACAAFVCGVLDAWTVQYVMGRRTMYPICFPSGTSCGQLVNAAVQFLTDHPDSRKAAGAGAVGYALSQMFSCKKS
jgi:Rap1a immunity proteins